MRASFHIKLFTICPFRENGILPSSKTDGKIAEINFCFGKARRWNGAGTMTEEKRSQNRNLSGTLVDHEVHFLTALKLSIVSSVLRSGITK